MTFRINFVYLKKESIFTNWIELSFISYLWSQIYLNPNLKRLNFHFLRVTSTCSSICLPNRRYVCSPGEQKSISILPLNYDYIKVTCVHPLLETKFKISSNSLQRRKRGGGFGVLMFFYIGGCFLLFITINGFWRSQTLVKINIRQQC